MSNYFYNLKATLAKAVVLFMLVFFAPFCGNSLLAQNRTYTYEVKNDSIIDCNHFRYTIWLSATTGLDSLRSAQVTLWLSSAFVNGTVDTVIYVSGSSDISATNIFGAPLVATPTVGGGSPPGTGGDSLVIRMNSTTIQCPGYILTTTPVRWAEFEITRSGGGCWGGVPNKLGFFTGNSGGQKVQSNVTLWSLCPGTNIVPPIINGTYLNDSLNDQTPVITSNPVDTSHNTCGGSVTFCVTATNSGVNPGSTAPITYQWRENGVPLANSAPYSGVTTPCLTITNPSLTLDSNYYSCAVTQGGTAISDSALLTIIDTGATSSSESYTTCDSYEWHGSALSASGDHTYHTSNSIGCDSLITLHLTVNNSSTFTVIAATCDSYVWNGTTYTTNGTFTHLFTGGSANGCDSAAILHLTIGIAKPLITYSSGALVTSCTNSGCNFVWYFGTDSLSMSALPTSNNDTIFPVNAGYYYVMVTDTNSCSNNSDKVYFTNVGLSSKTIASLFSVYPNPTSGKANIQLDCETPGNCFIKVLDLTGREVKSLALKTQRGMNIFVLDMSEYAKGVYVLSLQSGYQKQLTRLIVQ